MYQIGRYTLKTWSFTKITFSDSTIQSQQTTKPQYQTPLIYCKKASRTALALTGGHPLSASKMAVVEGGYFRLGVWRWYVVGVAASDAEGQVEHVQLGRHDVLDELLVVHEHERRWCVLEDACWVMHEP